MLHLLFSLFTLDAYQSSSIHRRVAFFTATVAHTLYNIPEAYTSDNFLWDDSTFQMILKASSDWCCQKKLQTQSFKKVIKTWCKWQTLGSLHQFFCSPGVISLRKGLDTFKDVKNIIASSIKVFFVKFKPMPLCLEFSGSSLVVVVWYICHKFVFLGEFGNNLMHVYLLLVFVGV